MWISNTKLSHPIRNFSVLCGLKISFVIRETVLVEVNTVQYAPTLKFRFMFNTKIKGTGGGLFPMAEEQSTCISLIILVVRCRDKRGGWGAAIPIWALMGTVGKPQWANPKPVKVVAAESHYTPQLRPSSQRFCKPFDEPGLSFKLIWPELESQVEVLLFGLSYALFLNSKANVKFRMWETNTDPENWRRCL